MAVHIPKNNKKSEEKIRLTMNELEVKQTTLPNLLRRVERFRELRDRRNNSE